MQTCREREICCPQITAGTASFVSFHLIPVPFCLCDASEMHNSCWSLYKWSLPSVCLVCEFKINKCNISSKKVNGIYWSKLFKKKWRKNELFPCEGRYTWRYLCAHTGLHTDTEDMCFVTITHRKATQGIIQPPVVGYNKNPRLVIQT